MYISDIPVVVHDLCGCLRLVHPSPRSPGKYGRDNEGDSVQLNVILLPHTDKHHVHRAIAVDSPSIPSTSTDSADSMPRIP